MLKFRTVLLSRLSKAKELLTAPIITGFLTWVGLSILMVQALLSKHNDFMGYFTDIFIAIMISAIISFCIGLILHEIICDTVKWHKSKKPHKV